ncbi:MAG: hypothetical protein QOF42_383, partial [Gammaproteobacteria bacterium]|nr:hypothetical protein [Gammaproteobacteria bacterium]
QGELGSKYLVLRKDQEKGADCDAQCRKRLRIGEFCPHSGVNATSNLRSNRGKDYRFPNPSIILHGEFNSTAR